MVLKVSLGSQLLTRTLAERGTKAELARQIGKGQVLVGRWATGERIPSEQDQSWLEDNANIPARSWGDPALKPKDLAEWIAAQGWTPKRFGKEASAEPTSNFPSDAPPALGDTDAA